VTRRVLFVNHTGELGGAELTLLPLAHRYRDSCVVALLQDGPLRQRLAASGVSVKLIAESARMLSVSRQGGILSALGAIPSVALAVWRVARFAREFDILYANSQKAAVVALAAGLVLRKPVIWYLHDILSADHFAVAQRRVVTVLANLAARSVIANSTESAAAFVAGGGNPRLVTIAPSGVDPVPFDLVSPTDISSVRREIGMGDGPLIGLFGRLCPWKGQHVVIDALSRLGAAHAMIVGDALFGEQAYRTALLSRAEALGLSGRLHWLGFRDDIPRLMRASDVVIHSSVAPEPYGRVIVEAMMARRPVIASLHGASAELLGARYPYLVHPGDPAALAAAIDQILSESPARIAHLVAANYERACALFSTQRMFDEIDRALAA